MRDVLARAADAWRRDDEGEIARRGVVRGRDGDVLRAALHTRAVVEEVSVGREAHPLDRRLERALGDHECSVGGRDLALEHGCGDARHARHDHRARLHHAEHDLEPVHRIAGNDDHSVAGRDAVLTERRRPQRGAVGDLEEVPVLDHAFLPERRERAALRVARQRLDDVAREVEAVGNLPAAVDESRSQGELERRQGNVAVAPTAPSDTQAFHGFSIIDPNRGFAERAFRNCCLIPP